MVRQIQYLWKHSNPFRVLAAFFLYKTGLCRLFVIRCGNYKIRYFRTSLSRALFINPNDREADERFLRNILNAGNVVVDVGANVGQLSILAAVSVGPSGKVYSFEPHPRTYDFLSRNVKLNRLKNVEMFNMALGERPDKLYFTDYPTDDVNSVTTRESALMVEVDTLTNVLSHEPSIDLLKIDTEGFELMVLRGASSILQRVEFIYFEASRDSYQANGYSFSDVSDILSNHGFKICEVKGNVLYDVYQLKGRNQNLLALRNLDAFLRRPNNIYVHSKELSAPTS